MNTVQQHIGKALYRLGKPVINIIFRYGAVRTRIFVVVNDEVLVIKNWIGTGSWSLPGGGLHPYEDPAEAAARELHEEVGIVIRARELELLTPEPIQLSHGTSSFRCMAYRLNLAKKPAVVPRKTEISDTKWIKRDALAQADVGEVLKQLRRILEDH